VPFGAVLDDALALVHFKAARKNIRLEDRRQVSLPALCVDRDRAVEAISHVIDNAVKFSPEGGLVIVETEARDSQLVVRVVDRGCGIPADRIETIWDSFSQMNTTLERGLEGLGLGLAISRYVVEAHGGDIAVESEAGWGSTFTISFPISMNGTGHPHPQWGGSADARPAPRLGGGSG